MEGWIRSEIVQEQSKMDQSRRLVWILDIPPWVHLKVVRCVRIRAHGSTFGALDVKYHLPAAHK